MKKGDRIYCTSFCNRGHRLVDGKPVDHECYVLPTEALVAEQRGDTQRALAVLDGWKNRRVHKGVKSHGAHGTVRAEAVEGGGGASS